MRHLQRVRFLSTVVLLFVTRPTIASITSTSIKGIHSDSLTLPNGQILQGLGVKIGQVEDLRPAVIGTDATANSDVDPAAVTLYDGQGITANANLGDGHAERVASVMISRDSTDSNSAL